MPTIQRAQNSQLTAVRLTSKAAKYSVRQLGLSSDDPTVERNEIRFRDFGLNNQVVRLNVKLDQTHGMAFGPSYYLIPKLVWADLLMLFHLSTNIVSYHLVFALPIRDFR